VGGLVAAAKRIDGGEPHRSEVEDDLIRGVVVALRSNQQSGTMRRSTRELGDTSTRLGEDGGRGRAR
jgi:hypothetical protein